MNNKKNNKIKKIVIVLLILSAILGIIFVCIANKMNKPNKEEQEKVKMEQEEKEKEKKELRKVSESERIKKYIGKYYKYIEEKEYYLAYELLYPEFKKNYFPTIESFEEYIKKQNYPELIIIDYNDIVSNGKYYTVKINIGDLLNRGKNLKKEQQLIIQENGYDDFYISLTL